MRFVDIHVDGFGRLVNRHFEFAPGLNVIIGPNEAGKSTLELALMTMLYGFFGEGAVSADMRALRDAVRPWEARARYGGRLTYRLDDGQEFRVVRLFGSRMTTTLETHPAGRDVSSRFPSQGQGRLYFADEQLGVSREVFDRICVVRQSELSALQDSADAITGTLMRVAASASSDTTATQALAALERAVRDEVGTDRAWTKPLARARERLQTLEEERARVEANRQQLVEQIERRNAIRETAQQQQADGVRLQYLRVTAELDILRQHIAASEADRQEMELWAEEAVRWQEWAAFPTHLRDNLLQFWTRRRDLLAELDDLRPAADRAVEQLETLERERAGSESRISALADARDVPADLLPLVQDLAHQWQTAEEAVQVAEKRRSQSEAVLREAALEVNRGSQELAPGLRLGLSGVAEMQQRLLSATSHETAAAAALESATAEWEGSVRTLTGDASKNAARDWSSFPAHLASTVDTLINRHQALQDQVHQDQAAEDAARRRLDRIKTERAAAERRVEQSRRARAVSAGDLSRVQMLVSQWRLAREMEQSARRRWEQSASSLQQGSSWLAQERQDLQPALGLGLAGLADLRQRWSTVNRRIAESEEALTRAEADWTRVNVDDARYAELERSAQAIKAGTEPAPAARRGCLGLFGTKSAPADDTPTDVKIFEDIKPIRDRLLAARAESRAAQAERDTIRYDIRARLGALAGDPPSDAQIARLAERLEALLVAERTSSERQTALNALKGELEAEQRRVEEAYALARAALTRLGFPGDDLESAAAECAREAERSSQAQEDDARLAQFGLQEEAIQRELSGYGETRRAAGEVAKNLSQVLASAGVECTAHQLEDAVAAFRAGVEAHRHWKAYAAAVADRDTLLGEIRAALGDLVGSSPDAAAFARLSRRLEAHLQAKTQMQARQSAERVARAEWEEAQRAAQQARDDLASALAELGLPAADLQQAVDQFAVECSRKAELEREEARLRQLRLEEAALRRDLDACREREVALERVELDLRQILHDASIEEGDLDTGLSAFEQGVERWRRWSEAEEQRQRAFDVWQARSGEGADETAASLQTLEAQRQTMLEQHIEWADLPIEESPEVYSDLLQSNEMQRLETRQLEGSIEEEIRRIERSMRHPAAIDEDIALARAEIDRLLQLRTDLERAYTHLSQATEEFQKQFAPRLEVWMSEGIERITRGRYSKVRINPTTLAVSLRSRERQDHVSVEHLSSGTQDVTYLLLRVAIARYMSRTDERLPLLLDDPFVRLDRTRQEQALSYLSALSEETQVFLFTKEERIRSWFETNVASSPTHRLHLLENVGTLTVA